MGELMSTLRATAYHEAGHAVASIFLDLDFEKVTIVPDDEAAGRITYADLDPEIQDAWDSGDRDDARVRQWVERSCIATLAGGIAQRRFSPRSDWKFGREGDARFPGVGKVLEPGTDLSNVVRRIDDIGFAGKVAATYEAYLEAQAEALIKAQWAAVQKVAEALVEQKTLFADDVLQLIFGNFEEFEAAHGLDTLADLEIVDGGEVQVFEEPKGRKQSPGVAMKTRRGVLDRPARTFLSLAFQ